MDFALDDTQNEVRELAEDVLRRSVDHSRPVDADTGYDAVAWKALSDAGLLSLAVPEELGGAGLGVIETSVVLTEIGRWAASVPAVATLALGVLPVVRFGTAAQRDEVLKGIESGRVLTAALNEPGDPLSGTPRLTAVRDGSELLLTGRKIAVPHAGLAERMLVSCEVPGEGAGIALVYPGSAGMSLHRTPSSAGSPEYTVVFDEVRVDAADLLGGTCDPEVLEGVHDLAMAGVCALAQGSVAGALELTSEHVRTRTQFGRPLAEFQAVAGQIADVYIASRTLDLATRAACYGLTRGGTSEDCRTAAAWLTESAPQALRTCHHLHGGVGLDLTYPLHRHTALVNDLTRFLGGAEASLDRVAS